MTTTMLLCGLVGLLAWLVLLALVRPALVLGWLPDRALLVVERAGSWAVAVRSRREARRREALVGRRVELTAGCSCGALIGVGRRGTVREASERDFLIDVDGLGTTGGSRVAPDCHNWVCEDGMRVL